ncbi:MAG: nucleotidyltransferase domain-containing protein [Ectothiorhodospiraceae bacterium]|nr:nucleotidyltransferase domain-containing protein [Ectothiorhodospiraceae bacterium]
MDKDNLVIAGSLVVPRAALGALAQGYHIKRLVLFGSAARGQLNADSDIDLLVEFKKGKSPSLGGMVRLKDDFSILFDGRRVDIATSSILNNPYVNRL